MAPFAERLLESVRRLPGVESAAVTTNVPFSGDHSDSVILAENYQMKPGESLVSPMDVIVSDGFFETMKIRLVKGRTFTPADRDGAMRVIVVDEKVAEHFWPGQDPIGRRMFKPENAQNLFATGPETKWLTVVGVVREVQYDGIALPTPSVGAYYRPFAQEPDNGFGMVVRTARGDGIVPELRGAVEIGRAHV